jgi:hypothetical protein
VANPASGTPEGFYYVRVATHSSGVTLVYQDRRNAFLYTAACPTSCTTPGNWTVRRVSRNIEIFVPQTLAPALQVDGSGAHHVVFASLAYIRY